MSHNTTANKMIPIDEYVSRNAALVDSAAADHASRTTSIDLNNRTASIEQAMEMLKEATLTMPIDEAEVVRRCFMDNLAKAHGEANQQAYLMNQVAMQSAIIEHLDRKLEALTKEGISEHIKALIDEQFGLPAVRRCKNVNARIDEQQKDMSGVKATLKGLKHQTIHIVKVLNDLCKARQIGFNVGEAIKAAASGSANKKRKANAAGSFAMINTDIEQFQSELKDSIELRKVEAAVQSMNIAAYPHLTLGQAANVDGADHHQVAGGGGVMSGNRGSNLFGGRVAGVARAASPATSNTSTQTNYGGARIDCDEEEEAAACAACTVCTTGNCVNPNNNNNQKQA